MTVIGSTISSIIAGTIMGLAPKVFKWGKNKALEPTALKFKGLNINEDLQELNRYNLEMEKVYNSINKQK